MSDHLGVSETIHRIEVGRRLRAAIVAKGISQADVVRALGTPANKLGNWLRGEHYPSAFFITQFCDRYGITTDWIYRGIVSGMDKTLADALWKSERMASEVQPPDNPPIATTTKRKERAPPKRPFPKAEGGRVKAKTVSRPVLTLVCPVVGVEGR